MKKRDSEAVMTRTVDRHLCNFVEISMLPSELSLSFVGAASVPVSAIAPRVRSAILEGCCCHSWWNIPTLIGAS